MGNYDDVIAKVVVAIAAASDADPVKNEAIVAPLTSHDPCILFVRT